MEKYSIMLHLRRSLGVKDELLKDNYHLIVMVWDCGYMLGKNQTNQTIQIITKTKTFLQLTTNVHHNNNSINSQLKALQL